MIHGRIPPPRPVRRRVGRDRPFRDRAFILRFLAGLALGVGACVALFLIPAAYFVEQNYQVFIGLAYDVRPGLVGHLEREIVWLRFFMISGCLATFGVCTMFAWRLLKQLLLPLDEVDDHLRSLTRGEWSKNPPRMPTSDVNRSFLLTYEYFHRTLRHQAESELKQLEKLIVDPAHREAFGIWKALIAERRSRLGLPAKKEVSGSFSESSAAEPSRRAS